MSRLRFIFGSWAFRGLVRTLVFLVSPAHIHPPRLVAEPVEYWLSQESDLSFRLPVARRLLHNRLSVFP